MSRFLESGSRAEPSQGLGMGDEEWSRGASVCVFVFTQMQVERPHCVKDERLGLAGPASWDPARSCLGSEKSGPTLWR